MKQYSVYIMMNSDRSKMYVGITNNVWRRRSEHRQGFNNSYAFQHQIFDVVYVEEFTRIEEALSRETQIKALGRLKKIELIKKVNPELKSLQSPQEQYLNRPSIMNLLKNNE